MYIIVDDLIRLELTDEKHAPALFEVVDANRAHLSRFLPWVEHMRSAEDFRIYTRTCNLLYQQNREVSFVIFYNDRLAGRIGLHHMNGQNKSAAIGYWLSKEAEQKGIITGSCTTLISYGFNNLQLHRIEIKAATNNFRSQAIPEKLHFKKEGMLREAELVNNEYLDLVLYSLLSREWPHKEMVEIMHE